jgi:hypothetical protein
VCGWVIFRSDDLGQAGLFFNVMFSLTINDMPKSLVHLIGPEEHSAHALFGHGADPAIRNHGSRPPPGTTAIAGSHGGNRCVHCALALVCGNNGLRRPEPVHLLPVLIATVKKFSLYFL